MRRSWSGASQSFAAAIGPHHSSSTSRLASKVPSTASQAQYRTRLRPSGVP